MYTTCKKKAMKKARDHEKGFTIMETLVSIAIFSIVSVFMSSIIINLATFALDTERTNDFIFELDNAASVIKNQVRAADTVKRCPNGLLIERTYGSSDPVYMLLRADTVSDDEGRLIMATLDGSDCSSSEKANPTILTSDTVVQVQNLRVTIDDDGNKDAEAKNTLLYIVVQACDPHEIEERKVFSCDDDKNPYKYIFGVSTRNVKEQE
ncbi:MAG: PulJ/GspJ family protein [Candidatus Dojkabacteria bacterium]